MIKGTIVPIIALLLLSGPVNIDAFTYSAYHKIEADLTCDYVIGVMPSVEINTTPNSKVCVQWYENGTPAFAPNIDREMGPYCRTTDQNGFTFFAMSRRFDYEFPLSPPKYFTAEHVCGGEWDQSSIDLTAYAFGLNVISINGEAPSLPFIDISLWQ